MNNLSSQSDIEKENLKNHNNDLKKEEEDNCSICLKTCEELTINGDFNYLLKCSSCSCKACNNCITRWYTHVKLNCPQCRKRKTFDVDIDYPEFFDEMDINQRQELTMRMFGTMLGIIPLEMHMDELNEDDELFQPLPPLPEYIINGAEFPFNGLQEFISNIWNTIPWQHKQRWEYNCIYENGLCVRFKIMLKKQYDPNYIFNENTGRFVKILGSVGKQILKVKSRTEIIEHPENPDKIMNPDSGKWVNRNGNIGSTIIRNYENLNQNDDVTI